MRELILVWRDTRMVVMVAVTAAIYAAVLIPMKVIMPLVPGFTEVRPGNVLPILFSFLFGPAAAWGAAFGNLVADCFGTLGPGSFFGFFGNFLFALLPYRLWRFWGGRVLGWTGRRGVTPDFRLGLKREGALYVGVCALASAACALVIGWGVDLLGFVDFKVLGNVIFLNNLAMGILLGPPLIAALGRRVAKWGLDFTGEMAEGRPPLARGIVASALVVVGAAGGVAAGNLYGGGLPVALLPFVAVAVLGALLL